MNANLLFFLSKGRYAVNFSENIVQVTYSGGATKSKFFPNLRKQFDDLIKNELRHVLEHPEDNVSGTAIYKVFCNGFYMISSSGVIWTVKSLVSKEEKLLTDGMFLFTKEDFFAMARKFSVYRPEYWKHYLVQDGIKPTTPPSNSKIWKETLQQEKKEKDIA